MKTIGYPVIFCLLIACTVPRQKQVWLGALQRTHTSETSKIVRVYFDKWGNLYAPSGFYIPYKDFFDPYKTNSTVKNSVEAGNLELYYTSHHDQLSKLAKDLQANLSNFTNAKDSFYAIQDMMIEKQKEEIEKHLGDAKILLVFIHGFNDPDPTGDYQQLRNLLVTLKYADGNTTYLEVFWDGLTANQANPALAGIWGRAQQNSAYVSLAVRDVLRRLPAETKIRIITHSLGASIGTGALFNTISKWNKKESNVADFTKDDNKWDYIDSVTRMPAPAQADIRIGMIAPAIPGESTFKDFKFRGKDSIQAKDNNISRIVVGYNKNDYAVSKRIGKSDFLASKFGATTLGCNLEQDGKTELTKVKEKLAALGFTDLVRETDFTQFPGTKTKEEHGLYYYLLSNKSTDFFKLLFE